MDDDFLDEAAERDLPFSARELDALRALVSFLESEIPEPYRAVAFRGMLDRVLGVRARSGVGAGPDRGRPPGVPPGKRSAPGIEPPRDAHEADLEPYRELLEAPGRILHKALATLEIGALQLGTPWMTPAEVEGFLREVAGVTTAYRSNISGALSEARSATRRRRRGRGYEYRLTERGSTMLRRAVRSARLS